MLHVALYNKLHKIQSPKELEDRVRDGWNGTGGRKAVGKDKDGNDIRELASPWLQKDWTEAKSNYAWS